MKTPEGIRPRQLASGRTVYDVNARVAGGPFRRRGFATVAQARAALTQAREAARTGRAVLDAATMRLTVGELAAEYLAAHPEWKPGTRRVKGSQWRTLARTFEQLPLTAVTPQVVADWRHKAEASGLALGTVEQLHGTLRAVLDRGRLSYGIANAAVLPRGKRSTTARGKRTGRVLSPEQLAKTFMAASERYLIVWQLMAWLGMRSGEVRGLTVDRVDFLRGSITIDRQLQRYGRDHEWSDGAYVGSSCGFETPKSHNGTRTIPVGHDVLDAIRDHVERYGTGPRGLVVSSHTDGALSDVMWTAEVRRVAKAVGFDVKGHDLRHTAGSALHSAGWSAADVARFLGDDVATVYRTYLHGAEPEQAMSDALVARTPRPFAHKPRTRRRLQAV